MGTLEKKGNWDFLGQWAAVFNWYSKASKRNSGSKIISLKDYLAKACEQFDKPKQQETKLIS